MSPGETPEQHWEGATLAEWRLRWRIPLLRILSHTTSTNDEARTLALVAAPAGAVVIADHQSAGRGREGRRWLAEPGESLLMSVLLRPEHGDERATSGPAPIRVGLAVCRAIERTTGLSVSLKWPNDVLAPDGRKIAGILCEAAAGAAPFVIAGVGINVLQDDGRWPPELADHAASLRAVTGNAPGRPALAGAVLEELRPFRPGAAELDPDELDAFRRRDALRGRAIELDGRPAGRADGIGRDGSLILLAPDGTRSVHSGTVRGARRATENPLPRDHTHASTATRPAP